MVTSSYPRFPGDCAGSFLGSMARALVRLGHSVHVVAPYDPALRPQDEGGVRVHRVRYAWPDSLCLMGHGRSLGGDERLKPVIPLMVPAYTVATLARTLRLHAREGFDVIHGHWAVPSGFIAALASQLTGVPLVVSLHGGGDVCLMQGSALYRAAGRYGFRRARRVTVCSQDMLHAVQEMGLGDGVVIPYGVDTDKYGTGRGEAMRRRLDLPPDALVIGALGRLTGIKGFQHLIAAAPAALSSPHDAYLVIGGDGDLLPQLQAQANALGIGSRVLFPRHISWQDTPDFYAMCDVVAVPSVTAENGNVDGLPNVLLEAMASGACVVASRVAGIPDVVRDGVNGALVAPADPAALAERLAALLGDASLRSAMGARARETMREGHGWGETAEVLERLYHEAILPGAAERPAWRMSSRQGPEARSAAAPTAHRPMVYDAAYARRKATKTLAILRQVLGSRLAQATCLDVGCASGLITGALAEHMGRTVGVELDARSTSEAASFPRGFTFLRADAQRLPVADGSIDVVICAQVYEHVADAEALVAEVRRVLKPGGICFFSGPNRLDPIERHYWLPFLSWLPRPLAHRYVRLTRRGSAYEERPRSYWGLKRLVRGFTVQDFTVQIVKHAEAYDCVEEMGRLRWVGRLPAWLLGALRPLYPNYNWVLHKPEGAPR